MCMWREVVITIPSPGRADADFGPVVVPADHPPDDGREGRPPEPWLLFLASIGTCAASFVSGYLTEHGLSAEGIRLLQRQDFKDDSETGLDLSIRIELPEDFPEEHREGIVRAAESCTVKQVIESGLRVSISL